MRQGALAREVRLAGEQSDEERLAVHSCSYRPFSLAQDNLPLSHGRYCDQPMDWRTRLAGLCCTASIFLLIIAGAALTWRAIQPMIAPSAPVVVNLQSFEAPPEPVREVPDGPEQIRQEERKSQETEDLPKEIPEILLTQTAPVTLPVPKIPQIKATRPVLETTAPRSLAAPEGQQASSNADAAWESVLLAHLERYRRYPARARAARQQGVVYVRFRMNRVGSVLSASVLRSSGVPVLDRAALDTLHRAQPLPAIPQNKPDELELTVPVEFFLS